MKDKIANAHEQADNFYINYFFSKRGFNVIPTERDCPYDYIIENDKEQYIAEVKFRSITTEDNKPLYINKKKIKKLKKIQEEEDKTVVIINAIPKDNKLIIHKLDDIDINNTVEKEVFNPSFRTIQKEEQVLITYNEKNIRKFNMECYRNIVRQSLKIEGVPKENKDMILKKWS